jgi:hypothetical protein
MRSVSDREIQLNNNFSLNINRKNIKLGSNRVLEKKKAILILKMIYLILLFDFHKNQ